MKKLKRITSFLLCVAFGYILSIYTYPRFLSPKPYDSKIEPSLYEEPESSPLITTDITTNEENKKRPYVVDIPAKYFDPDRAFEYGDTSVLMGIDVIFPPVPTNISAKNIKVINEQLPIDEIKKSQKEVGPEDSVVWTDINKDGIKEFRIDYLDPIDVDNDGVKEEIILVPTSMNHGGGEILIVKNNRIIFKSGNNAGANISGSKSNNGFYTVETIDAGTLFGVGGGRRTRYIYDQGKFIPVWLNLKR